MLYLDYLQFALTVNGNNIDVMPQSFSFSQIDSIYNLYNMCSPFSMSDLSGIIQEYFIITEGTEINLSFGAKYGDVSTVNQCPYVVTKINLDEPGPYGTLTGTMNCIMTNLFYQKQAVGNKGYFGKISDIVKTILSNYQSSISSVDIDLTGNEDYWYRTQMTDAKFINDMLLPNAYSSGTNNSPYFCFITSDGVFHFRTLHSMLKANPVTTFEYRVPAIMNDRENQSQLYQIKGFRRWQEGSDETKKFRHRNIYSINRTDGSLNLSKDNITDYPASEQGNLSIINDEGLTTDFLDLGYDESILGRKDNLKGQIINSTRDAALLDRFLITTPYHPEVLAGNVVKVNFFMQNLDTNSYVVSPNFSGNYLVEKSEHVWSGLSKKAYSMFNIGRKTIPNIPNTYSQKSKLMVMRG